MSTSNDYTEIEQLAQAVCDGKAGPEVTARLNELLEHDLLLCQWYLGYVDVHAHLGRFSQDMSPGRLEALMVSPGNLATPVPKVRRNAVLGFVAVAACVMISVLGYFLYQPPAALPLGVIATYSVDVEWDGGQKPLGTVLRLGDHLKLLRGHVGIETKSGTIISFRGPASVTLTGLQETAIERGMVLLKVAEADKGYTISTPEMNIVDLGTEFLVSRQVDSGTSVTVQQGEVEVSVFDEAGALLQVQSLTTGRSARVSSRSTKILEIPQLPDWDFAFQLFNRNQQGIRKSTGTVRLSTISLTQLDETVHQTRGHVLVIPEQQEVIVEAPIPLEEGIGADRLPAGMSLTSYLVHYNPPLGVTKGAIGSITFHQPIYAVLVNTNDLVSTDSLFANPESRFSIDPMRGFELISDDIQISEDRKTISFHPVITGLNQLDQCRILLSQPSN